MKYTFLLLSLLFSQLFSQLLSSSASAGVFEISATGNYRKTVIDEFNYSSSQSIGGSLAYYFWEMSALELSYTQGTSSSQNRITSGNVSTNYTQITDFLMYGADFIFTLAQKDWAIKPYMKLGAAKITKSSLIKIDNISPQLIPAKDSVVPTLGLGVKIGFTETISLKLGVDMWFTSDSTASQSDVSGRAGLSWMF